MAGISGACGAMVGEENGDVETIIRYWTQPLNVSNNLVSCMISGLDMSPVERMTGNEE